MISRRPKCQRCKEKTSGQQGTSPDFWQSIKVRASRNSDQLSEAVRVRFACVSTCRDAAARIVKRPWFADGFLKEVVERCITGKSAPATIISNSTIFKEWFNEALKDMEHDFAINSSIRDLHLAKQRFDSTQTPLARACLYFGAWVMTSYRIFQ